MTEPTFPSDDDQRIYSQKHHEVAEYLTDVLFKKIEESTGKNYADALREVRAIVWEDEPERQTNIPAVEVDLDAQAADRHQRYKEILERFPEGRERTSFMEYYARMGHLYEIAALVARDNLFNDLRQTATASRKSDRKYIPGGVREYIDGQVNTPIDKLIANINAPVFEVVMTAHPTNVNATESIKAQREINLAINQVRGVRGQTAEPNTDPVGDAIGNYLKAPLVPVDDYGRDKNLSVQDETELALFYLGNAYDDLPATYERFDESLERKAKEKSEQYNPLDLNLGLRFSSWVGGDKDGNANVNADTTLATMAAHKYKIIEHYLKDLDAMGEGLPESLRPWKERLEEVQKEIWPIYTRLSKLKAGEFLAEGELDDYSAKIALISNPPAPENPEASDQEKTKQKLPLDPKEFKLALEKAYSGTQNEATKKATLDLLRRVKVFGFNFGKVEYRETAEEYTRVVALVLRTLKEQNINNEYSYYGNDYETLSEADRVGLLTKLLNDQDKGVREALDKAFEAIKQEGVGKPYKPEKAKAGEQYDLNGVYPIAYHTIKRMELARDHPEMVTHNVLAECQNTSNLLEAQFLQVAVGKVQKTEDGQDIVNEKGEPQIKRPLLDIVPLFEDPETMAHVDSIMKRAYENSAYQNHLTLLKERNGGADTQQIQIAHSDNMRRSGLFAARALIEEAHEKLRALGTEFGIKTQFFEGGSNSDALRNGTRATSAMVNQYGLHDFIKITSQGGDLLNFFNNTDSIVRMQSMNILNAAKGLSKKNGNGNGNGKNNGNGSGKLERDPEVNQSIRDKFKETLTHYQQEIFTEGKIGEVLGELKALFGGAGNISSRAGARPADQAAAEKKPVVFAKVDSVKAAPVDPQKVRTITYSELLQQGGLILTWLCSKVSGVTEKRAPEMKKLYKQSSVFADVMDRIGFGTALSNLQTLQETCPALDPGKYPESFMKEIEEDYHWGLRSAHAAMTGYFPEETKRGKRMLVRPGRTESDLTVRELKELMIDQMPHLKQLIHDKGRFMEFLQVKRGLGGQPDIHEANIDHIVGDLYFHGRFVPADDPGYAELLSPRAQRHLDI